MTARGARVKVSPKQDAQYKKSCAQGVANALALAGSGNNLARILGVSSVAIVYMKQRGQISRNGALLLSQLLGFPMNLEDIRPDIKVLDPAWLKDPVFKSKLAAAKAYLKANPLPEQKP